MNTCSNCGRSIGCSCQIRTASNGQKACTNCLNELEKKLILEKIEKEKND